MSYAVDTLGGGTTFAPGTSLLLAGPSMVTDEHLLDAAVPRADERSIVVTTNTDAPTVFEELLERNAARERVGVIDCTGAETVPEDVAVRQLNSPGDLTGISLEFAKLLEETDGSTGVRIGFTSISTTLMYVDLRTMFRFLHVFTARIRSGDMLGVFTIDPAMHDEQTHNTVRAIFDCEARVTDSGAELRGTGFRQ